MSKLTPTTLELQERIRELEDEDLPAIRERINFTATNGAQSMDRQYARLLKLEEVLHHARNEFNERIHAARDRANEKIHKLTERIHGLETRLESLEKFPPQVLDPDKPHVQHLRVGDSAK